MREWLIALGILINKKVSVNTLEVLDLKEYNAYCNLVGGCKELTEDEYNLLKVVMNEEYFRND